MHLAGSVWPYACSTAVVLPSAVSSQAIGTLCPQINRLWTLFNLLISINSNLRRISQNFNGDGPNGPITSRPRPRRRPLAAAVLFRLVNKLVRLQFFAFPRIDDNFPFRIRRQSIWTIEPHPQSRFFTKYTPPPIHEGSFIHHVLLLILADRRVATDATEWAEWP